MALTWNITNVMDRDKFYDDDGQMLPQYQAIIMPGTLITQIGELTVKTIPEFYARLHLYEKMHGALVYGPGGVDVFTKFETVVDMKGLKTNVWPMETRTKWMNRQVKQGFLDSIVKDKERELPKIIEQQAEELAEKLEIS